MTLEDVLAKEEIREVVQKLARDVRSVLQSLPPEQRAILVLRDLEGLSEREAAAQLDVAHGTVKSRLHRARAAFAARWRS